MHIVLGLVVGLIFLAGLVALACFVRWRNGAIKRLRSSLLVPTAGGSIDCARAGPDHAPAVLVLHGGLGGWDQAMMLAEDMNLPEHFRVIAPSRPGYLRTPLDVGRTTEAAADAMVGLLDALNIPQAIVFGISGGGPTALAIASRHPQRVAGLVMVCAISHRHVQPAITAESAFGRLLFSNPAGWLMDVVCWLTLRLAQVTPAFLARRILNMTELGSPGEIRQRVRALKKFPARMRWISRLLEHSFPVSPRKIGLNNDLAQFASLKPRIAERTTCPTLVIHGRLDGNVPVAHAEAVLSAADQAESLIIDDGGHLLWLHARIDEVRVRLLTFLRANQPPAMAPMTRKGSLPEATASGKGASGDSSERSF